MTDYKSGYAVAVGAVVGAGLVATGHFAPLTVIIGSALSMGIMFVKSIKE